MDNLGPLNKKEKKRRKYGWGWSKLQQIKREIIKWMNPEKKQTQRWAKMLALLNESFEISMLELQKI